MAALKKAVPPPPPQHYGVRFRRKWVSGFTYPPSTTRVDKAWEASPGIHIASCCKAILDARKPFTWTDRSCSDFVAAALGVGAKVVLIPPALLAELASVASKGAAPVQRTRKKRVQRRAVKHRVKGVRS